MTAPARAMTLASGDIAAGRPIAETFVYDAQSCHGKNASPGLRWNAVPRGTKEFALTMTDPDAPMARPFVHWTLYHIGGTVRAIARGALPSHAVAGPSDWGATGYGGPCPPPGALHHYVIRLDALDTILPIGNGTSESGYERLRAGHLLATATLVATYRR